MMYQIKPAKQSLFNRNYLKIFAVFFLISILVFLLSFLGSTRFLITGALSPFLKTGNYFYNFLSLINKNETDLTTSEQIKMIDYESLKQENEKLRAELKLKLNPNFITAPIIAKPPQVPLDSLYLEKGSDAGIKNGDFVLVGDRILIGRIVKVSKNKSTAALNSFAGSLSYGFVSRTDESLETKGAGGGNMEAKVPIDFDIVIGDKIMTNGSFNYLIAVVGAIEEDRSAGFKNILMSLPVNISKINFVFVEPIISE